MREILLRGKRVDNGEWVYGNHLYDDMTGKHFIVPFGNISESEKVNEEGCCYCVGFEVIPETIGQYTGLTDKNGNKIFEGDILKTSIGCIFSVEWEKEGRFLGFTSERKIVYVNREPKAEVIGNIHDNPELLEDNNEISIIKH